MCDVDRTPEGLLVCRDTGEVLGVEFDHHSYHETPQFEPFTPAVHGLYVNVRRPMGPARGFSSPGARDRVKTSKFNAREYPLVKVLKFVSEVAGLLELPSIVVYDSAITLRKLYSSKNAVSECTVAAVILHSLASRGFSVPHQLYDLFDCSRGEVTSELYRLQRVLGSSTKRASLLEALEGKVEELCAATGCGDAELARRFVRRLYEVDKMFVQSFTVPTLAQAAVYLAARLRGVKIPLYMDVYMRVMRKLASRGLKLEVKVKCS